MTTHPQPRSFGSASAKFALAAPDKHPTARGSAAPLPAAASRHGWTPARQGAFLRELAASHNVSAAARSVGMSRQSAYKLRSRLRGKPFGAAWEAAFRTRFDALAEAALDRALNGVEVPHYYNGELVGTSRRYDERLTLALLAMRGNLMPHAPGEHDPASAFEATDLAGLIERVEFGPQDWHESPDAELDARYAQAEPQGGGSIPPTDRDSTDNSSIY